MILRIKEEINANEEKTSSSSASSTPSHSAIISSSTQYQISGYNNSYTSKHIEGSVPTINKTNHIYSNGTEDMNVLTLAQNSLQKISNNSPRNKSEQEMCSMMLGCDISSSTSGVDTSTAGSSSCSDSNGLDGKNRDCNESGLSRDAFDEHSTSLVI